MYNIKIYNQKCNFAILFSIQSVRQKRDQVENRNKIRDCFFLKNL